MLSPCWAEHTYTHTHLPLHHDLLAGKRLLFIQDFCPLCIHKLWNLLRSTEGWETTTCSDKGLALRHWSGKTSIQTKRSFASRVTVNKFHISTYYTLWIVLVGFAASTILTFWEMELNNKRCMLEIIRNNVADPRKNWKYENNEQHFQRWMNLQYWKYQIFISQQVQCNSIKLVAIKIKIHFIPNKSFPLTESCCMDDVPCTLLHIVNVQNPLSLKPGSQIP